MHFSILPSQNFCIVACKILFCASLFKTGMYTQVFSNHNLLFFVRPTGAKSHCYAPGNVWVVDLRQEFSLKSFARAFVKWRMKLQISNKHVQLVHLIDTVACKINHWFSRRHIPVFASPCLNIVWLICTIKHCLTFNVSWSSRKEDFPVINSLSVSSIS